MYAYFLVITVLWHGHTYTFHHRSHERFQYGAQCDERTADIRARWIKRIKPEYDKDAKVTVSTTCDIRDDLPA